MLSARFPAVRRLVGCLSAAALVSACSTHQPTAENAFAGPASPVAQLGSGAIVLTPSPLSADIGFDAPSDRLESAGEGAEAAARKVMDTPALGNGQLETVVGVFGFVAAPFAAAYGAISAKHERLTPSGLTAAEDDLKQVLRANAGTDFLRQQVAEFAHQQTHRLVLCPGLTNTPAAPPHSVGGMLELAVEQLRLKAIAPNQYVLWIQVRARLLTPHGATPVLDRHYHYQSGPDMFVDWTRQGALEGVAQTGYRILAEQIAKDVFEPASEPPLRLGPGEKASAVTSKASAYMGGRPAPSIVRPQWPAVHLLPVAFQIQVPDNFSPQRSVGLSGRQSRNHPHFLFVSLQEQAGTSVEVHAGGTGQPSRLVTPEEQSAAPPSAETQTEWRMDGLENDRNSVVQALACVAAVPLGLWDQTLGAVRRHSREKTAKTLKKLDAIPEQEQFETKLADEVARRLRAQTADEVRRTDAPLTLGFSNARSPVDESPTAPGIANGGNTALEIRVVKAQLQGKTPNSRSRSLCVQIQATLLRTSDGQELYRRPILYRSATRPLKQWAGSDGRLVRQELEECSKLAARALANELVRRQLLAPPEAAPAPHRAQPGPAIQ